MFRSRTSPKSDSAVGSEALIFFFDMNCRRNLLTRNCEEEKCHSGSPKPVVDVHQTGCTYFSDIKNQEIKSKIHYELIGTGSRSCLYSKALQYTVIASTCICIPHVQLMMALTGRTGMILMSSVMLYSMPNWWSQFDCGRLSFRTVVCYALYIAKSFKTFGHSKKMRGGCSADGFRPVHIDTYTWRWTAPTHCITVMHLGASWEQSHSHIDIDVYISIY